MSRHTLHDLVDRIPEEELSAAQRFLEYLAVNPAHRAAWSAPPDDEPVTEGTRLRLRGREKKSKVEKLSRTTTSCGSSV